MRRASKECPAPAVSPLRAGTKNQYGSVAICAALALSFAPSARADEPHAWDKSCAAVANVEPPASDRPTKAQSKALKGCDAASFYYGINVPKDYEKARLCAFAQLERDREELFGGTTILMMLYANGYGVKTNLRLARRYVCDQADDAAQAETEGRLDHLDRLAKGDASAVPFDFCQAVTSGMMQGQCESLQDQLVAMKRDAKLAALTASFTPADQDAFKKLQAAAKAFAEARGDNEVDLSGTGRIAFEIEEVSAQQTAFIAMLEQLEQKKAPVFSAAQYAQEDQQLNALYQQVQTTQNLGQWGTVNAEQIKLAQRAWIHYRDAWAAFAAVRYPALPPESVPAWLTQKRSEMLREFKPPKSAP